MNRLAIFDCDGTLVDSAGPIHAATFETFAELGLQGPSMDLCRRAIGLGLVEAMALLLPGADAETHALFAERYKAHFLRARTEGRVHEPLFPGILELLDALEESGWLLAVATGKSDRGLRLCLESHGIHARFVSLQTGDRHPSKPSPSMALQAIADAGAVAAATIVVGDTSYDMGMAKAAGAIGIGAGWGYHDADELFAAGAVGVARTPPEVLELITEHVDG